MCYRDNWAVGILNDPDIRDIMVVSRSNKAICVVALNLLQQIRMNTPSYKFTLSDQGAKKSLK